MPIPQYNSSRKASHAKATVIETNGLINNGLTSLISDIQECDVT
jgi:hypothetical protein